MVGDAGFVCGKGQCGSAGNEGELHHGLGEKESQIQRESESTVVKLINLSLELAAMKCIQWLGGGKSTEDAYYKGAVCLGK